MTYSRLISLTSDMVNACDSEDRARAAKGMVCLAWPHMRYIDRREFQNRLDFETLEFDPKPTPLDVILWRWGWIMDKARDDKLLDDWSAKFAKRVNERRKWSNWNPTDKEEKQIRRIYRDVMFGENPEILEKGNDHAR